MAKDKALGSSQDDEEIFDAGTGGEDQDTGDNGPAPEADDQADDDDSAAVSAAIAEQHRGNRQDLKSISEAIKGARLGNELRADAQPAPPKTEEKPGRSGDSVPLATFLEVEKELRELRRQAQQPSRQAQPQPQQQQPRADLGDMLYTDPERFVQTLTQSFEQRLAAVELNRDLQYAADKNSDVWDTAWTSFMERVEGGRDPALYQMVMNSRSPGQSIADWYRKEQTLSEVGTDPKAYRERILQEALTDDAFVAQIAERLGLAYDAPAPRAPQRTAAPAVPTRGPNGQFQPAASVTRLPTSLSRLSGRAAEADGDDGDGSEEAIFNAGRNRRR